MTVSDVIEMEGATPVPRCDVCGALLEWMPTEGVEESEELEIDETLDCPNGCPDSLLVRNDNG